MPASETAPKDRPRYHSLQTTMIDARFSLVFRLLSFAVALWRQSDILSPKFALEWMSDFEKLQEALDTSGDESYMNSLNRSLALVLDEFYNALTAVGVSAASGDGMPALFKVCVYVCEVICKQMPKIEDVTAEDCIHRIARPPEDCVSVYAVALCTAALPTPFSLARTCVRACLPSYIGNRCLSAACPHLPASGS